MRYILLMIVFVIAFAKNSYAEQFFNAENSKLMWQAIMNYLEWDNYWQEYGEPSVEDCYQKLLGKGVKVTFFHYKEKQFTDDCNRYEVKEEDIDIIKSYIENSSMSFSIGYDSGKYGAVGSVETAGICYAGERTRSKINELRKPGKSEIYETTIKIPKLRNYKFPPKEKNLKSEVVLNAIRRTISSEINSYIKYFNEKELENIKKNKKLIVGRFRDEDPYIWVYYKGTNAVYQLDFPSVQFLKNEKMCMPLWHRDLNTFRDDEDRATFNSLYKKIKSNSIEIDFNPL